MNRTILVAAVAVLLSPAFASAQTERADALLGLARVKRDGGDWTASREYFEQAARLRPLSVGEQTEYFWIVADLDPRAALPLASALLSARPGADDIRERAIGAAVTAGDEQAVVLMAQAGLTNGRSKALWHRRTAESFARQGDHAAAARAWQQAVASSDGTLEDRAGLALALELSGEAARAMNAWDEVPVDARRTNRAWQESRLRAVVRAAPSAMAIDALSNWLREHPDDLASRETLADRLTRAGRADEALAVIEPLTEGPDGSRWIRRQIDLARSADRRDLAIGRLTHLHARRVATLVERRLLAELVIADRDWTRAEALLTPLAAESRTCDAALAGLIDRVPDPAGTDMLTAYVTRVDCSGATDWIERAIARQVAAAGHAQALSLMERLPVERRAAPALRRLEGQLWLWTGRPADAIPLLRPLAEAGDIEATDALVDAFRLQGQASRAWAAASSLVTSASTPASRLASLVGLALEADRPAAALAILDRPQLASIGEHARTLLRARALQGLGQPAAASTLFQNVPAAALDATAALDYVDAVLMLQGPAAALGLARRLPVSVVSDDLLVRRLALERVVTGSISPELRQMLAGRPSSLGILVDIEIALLEQRPLDALGVLDARGSALDSLRAQDLRATALAGAGSYEESAGLLGRLRAERPDYLPFIVREAELRWRREPTAANLSALRALAEAYPDDRRIRVAVARVLASERRHESVLDALGGPSQVGSLPLEGRVLMADSLVALGQDQTALTLLAGHDLQGGAAVLRAALVARIEGAAAGDAAFRTLASRSDAGPDLYLSWAEHAAPASRVEILQQATARFPAQARLWEQLAVAHAVVGDHAASLTAAGRAVELDPGAADAWYELIAGAARDRRSQLASQTLARFSTVAETRPAMAIAMADRVASLIRTADDPLLVHALRWVSSPADGLELQLPRTMARVRLLAAAERWTEAVTAADVLARAHLDSTAALRLRADVLSWAGRYNDALAAFDTYLERVPDDLDAARQQARVAGWAGRFGEARAYYRALQSRRPDDAVVRAEAEAKLAFFDGRWEQAARAYAAWLRLEPDNSEARFEMAEALRAAGAATEAASTLAMLAPEGGHRLAEAARARQAWQRQPAMGATFDLRSTVGYEGQRLLDVRRTGGGLNLVMGSSARTDLAAEVNAMQLTSPGLRRSGYEGIVAARRLVGRRAAFETEVSMLDLSGTAAPAWAGRALLDWRAGDRWSATLGAERELIVENMAMVELGMAASGVVAGVMFDAPLMSMEAASRWQELSDGNRRSRHAITATRALSERWRHVRLIGWAELLDYRDSTSGYFSPRAFVRADGGVQYTHAFAPPRFRDDRMNRLSIAYLIGTDSRGTRYQHPSVALSWELTSALALSVRADAIRSATYNEDSLVVTLHLIGGAYTR
jgi:tetratricopeptide (TPR) repeat protein